MNRHSRWIAVLIMLSFVSSISAQTVTTIISEQDALIDTVTAQIMEMKNKITSLSLQVSDNEEKNKELLEEISKTEEEMTTMKDNIASLKTALISNKEDTSNMIDLFAEAEEEIAKLKEDTATLKNMIERKNEQLRNASIFFNIAVPTIGLIGLIPSIKLMTDGDNTGYYMMAADLGFVLTLELTWNIGRGLEAKIPTLTLW